MINPEFGIKCFHYKGIDIVPSPTMQSPIKEKRTWRERLFTLPFEPFKKFKIIGYKPMKEAILIKMNNSARILFCAPVMADKIKQEIDAGNWRI